MTRININSTEQIEIISCEGKRRGTIHSRGSIVGEIKDLGKIESRKYSKEIERDSASV